MSEGASPALVQRAVELSYANRKRTSALRWSALNAALLLLFAYDLSCKCPGYMSALHYAELALACVLCANLLQHALSLLPRRRADATFALSPLQLRLLGLAPQDLDSSMRMVEDAEPSGPTSAVSAEELAISLSPTRTWRASTDASHSPHSPHSPHSSHSPPRLGRDLEPQDEFIADRRSLSDYLRHYDERSRLATGGGADAEVTATGGVPRAPRYQLATTLSETGAAEEGGANAAGALGSPRVWWRLELDPQRLTQFNLNLRLWLQVTILERLVREMDALDAAFARHGLATIRLGEVSVERLRALATGAGAGPAGALPALLPFLEPFADQRYVVQRIRELARGGCLSEYRWCGGGARWAEAEGRPTDAELLLALLAAYLDAQLPAPPPRPFSSQHVSAAPAPPPSGPGALAIHRVTSRPPHYALVLGEETLEVARGRNNLLHTILLFLAAAARRRPPARALSRHHLGPAGLNMLWIIGR